MKDIKLINELSGKVLEASGKVEMMDYKISLIESGKPVYAVLHLEIDRNKKASSMHNLEASEVLIALKRIRDGWAKNLEYLQKEYNALQ